MVVPRFSSAEAIITGELDSEKDDNTSLIVKLDAGVKVKAEISISGDQVTYQLRAGSGEAIRLLDRERGAIIRGAQTETFEFIVPSDGKVRVHLITGKSSPAKLQYYFSYERSFELKVKVESQKREYRIFAALTKQNGAVVSNPKAKVAMKIRMPNGKSKIVKLKDDGKNRDGRAKDGIYGVVLKNPPTVGDYRLSTVYVITENKQRFVRNADTVLTVKP